MYNFIPNQQNVFMSVQWQRQRKRCNIPVKSYNIADYCILLGNKLSFFPLWFFESSLCY
jgi:hypothetical protein